MRWQRLCGGSAAPRVDGSAGNPPTRPSPRHCPRHRSGGRRSSGRQRLAGRLARSVPPRSVSRCGRVPIRRMSAVGMARPAHLTARARLGARMSPGRPRRSPRRRIGWPDAGLADEASARRNIANMRWPARGRLQRGSTPRSAPCLGGPRPPTRRLGRRVRGPARFGGPWWFCQRPLSCSPPSISF
jgi:hypothetical protein